MDEKKLAELMKKVIREEVPGMIRMEVPKIIQEMVPGMIQKEMSPMKKDISELKTDVSTLKKDFSSLKTDVGTLKEDVTNLKTDVGTLKEDVSSLKADNEQLKEDVTSLKADSEKLKEDVADIKSDIEDIRFDMRLSIRQIENMEKHVHRIKKTLNKFKDDWDNYHQWAVSEIDRCAEETQLIFITTKDLEQRAQNGDLSPKSIEEVQRRIKWLEKEIQKLQKLVN